MSFSLGNRESLPKCRTCQIPIWQKQAPELDQNLCQSCNLFLTGLRKLESSELERQLLSRDWQDGLFAVFCEEYKRRGLRLPQ